MRTDASWSTDVRLAAVVLVPSLVGAIAARWLGVERPLLDYDYAVAALAVRLAGPVIGAMLFLAAFSIDLLLLAAPVYRFDIVGVLGSLSELGAMLRAVPIWASVLVTVLLIGVAAGAARAVPRGSLRTPWLLPVLFGLVLAGDALNGTTALHRRDAVLVPLNLAGSPAGQVGRVAIVLLVGPADDSPRAGGTVAAATTAAFGPEGPTGTTLVVLVESLGLLQDTAARRLVFAPLSESRVVVAQYERKEGAVLAQGATTAAEFRELCSERRTHVTAPSRPMPTCLPARLRAAGFGTFAVHGYRAAFFARDRWWPKIGFDTLLFDRELETRGAARSCGTLFRGRCDVEVARIVGELLREDTRAPRFVYWLTLNSHLPVDGRVGAGECRSFGLSVGPSCALAAQWRGVLTAIADIVADSGVAPSEVLVVGDHPPPGTSAALRRAFVPGLVPWLHLRRRPA